MTEEQEREAVREALSAAGVDPSDLERFVNTPHPEIPGLGPSRFDSRRAYPVLMEWLPRVHARNLIRALAWRIRECGKRSESAQALIGKYRAQPMWELGDTIASTMTSAEHGDVVTLCAQATAGRERQMLVYALWRIKTDEARSLIRDLVRDPSVAGHAMYAARRAFGNEEAKALIAPLADDPEVGTAARDALKRIDRARR